MAKVKADNEYVERECDRCHKTARTDKYISLVAAKKVNVETHVNHKVTTITDITEVDFAMCDACFAKLMNKDLRSKLIVMALTVVLFPVTFLFSGIVIGVIRFLLIVLFVALGGSIINNHVFKRTSQKVWWFLKDQGDKKIFEMGYDINWPREEYARKRRDGTIADV